MVPELDTHDGAIVPAAKSVMGVYHKAGQPVIKIFMATVLKIVEQTADARKETEDFIIRNSMTFMITFSASSSS